MQVGVCVNHKPDKDIDESFAKIIDNGFKECQLISWNASLWTDEEAKNQ